MSAVSVAVTVNGGPGSNVFDTVNWMVTVHDVDAGRNLLLVKGAVPGPKNGYVEVREDTGRGRA